MTEPKVKLLHAPSALSISDVFVEADRIYLLKTGRPATGVLSIQNQEGRVESRFEIYNGQKHGLYEEYFASGDLRYWCRYLHGKQDLYDERYDEHGRLIQSDCWEDGNKHGRCERYELGKISSIQHYRRGKLHSLGRRTAQGMPPCFTASTWTANEMAGTYGVTQIIKPKPSIATSEASKQVTGGSSMKMASSCRIFL